ncbi:hypothetical protein DIPPA_08826 [Diplonema papillatum]|nr:hypothetical protein DIPPA_08826 [Diplonema papillatum]
MHTRQRGKTTAVVLCCEVDAKLCSRDPAGAGWGTGGELCKKIVSEAGVRVDGHHMFNVRQIGDRCHQVMLRVESGDVASVFAGR